jgi:23S rRNA (guanosine2251-2'-O)-methyltransferase
MSQELFIRNPHSILEVLKHRPKDVLEITFPRDRQDGAWNSIESLCERHRIRVVQSSGGGPQSPRGRDRERGRTQKTPVIGRESGHGALIRPRAPVAIEELFREVRDEERGVWLALDCLQDPQNLGAIFRSAAFFGIRGIVMTTERSAPMTSTVYDIASGGVENVPFVQAINLKQALEHAKEAGVWILGTSEHAKEPLSKVERDRPWLVVMGNEEKGIRRLTEESCDVMCSVAPAGDGVTSLNVSVATGILLFHLGG